MIKQVKVRTEIVKQKVCFTETAMGIRFDIETQMQESYEEAVHKMGLLYIHRVLRPWLYVNAIFPFTPTYWEQKFTAKILHKFSTTIVNKRKANFVPDNVNPKKKMVMLDVLLSQSDVVDLNGIREEVDTFVFEGHDTTCVSLGFTVMLLANHRPVQEKVYRELERVFGNSTAPPTYRQLQDLHYLEMCIKESLRLYPSVPMIVRITSRSFETPSGYSIPEGVTVLVDIYGLHRNRDVYPDPEKFDPDRFLPENTANRHPFAYLPFSGGPRNCIGGGRIVRSGATLRRVLLF